MLALHGDHRPEPLVANFATTKAGSSITFARMKRVRLAKTSLEIVDLTKCLSHVEIDALRSIERFQPLFSVVRTIEAQYTPASGN